MQARSPFGRPALVACRAIGPTVPVGAMARDEIALCALLTGGWPTAAGGKSFVHCSAITTSRLPHNQCAPRSQWRPRHGARRAAELRQGHLGQRSGNCVGARLQRADNQSIMAGRLARDTDSDGDFAMLRYARFALAILLCSTVG